MQYPSIDFETYSEAGYSLAPDKVRGLGPQGKGGLPVVGTPNYASHPSAEVLCLRYDLLDGKGVRGWMPGAPNPTDLLDHVRAGGIVAGWNVTFEWWIWNEVCTRKYGWPPLAVEQTRCTMARARRHSLPGGLDNCAKVMGTLPKDPAGKNLIQRLTRPHTPTKSRPGYRRTPADSWSEIVDLYEYCGDDVRAEMDIAARIPDLTPEEFATWQLDQKINARGVQVDTELLDACLDLLGQAEAKYTAELQAITGGAVRSVSEIQPLDNWLLAQGVQMPDLTKDSVSDALKMDWLPGGARRALEIRQLLGAANVKKLRTLKLQVSADGRLRDQYQYCGADRTGRASAGGVQLQNITSKGPATAFCEACDRHFCATGREFECPRCGAGLHLCMEVPDWDSAWAVPDILTRDLAHVERVWGNPIALLCGMLRGLFIAHPGYRLVVVDFSAIEAVVLACLARCQWRIDVFSTHGKIYEQSGAGVMGLPLRDVLDHKQRTGVHHPARKLGKTMELSCGYGGWINAAKAFGADDFMSDDEIKAAILKWRDESPEIVAFWGGQFRWCGPGKWDFTAELHGLEGAAIMAVQRPGTWFMVNDIGYYCGNDILYCRLPSGRYLHYHRPELHPDTDKLNRGPSLRLTFEGYNSNAAKGPVGWYRMETFGGRLAENCIAENTLVLTDYGWLPIQYVTEYTRVHDGVEFVRHGGTLFKSEQSCVSVDGVLMTPDHEVLTDGGWQAAQTNPSPYRPDIRHVDGSGGGGLRREKTALVVPVPVRDGGGAGSLRSDESAEERAGILVRVPARQERHAPDDATPRVLGLAQYVRPLQAAVAPGVAQLRRAWYSGVRRMAEQFRGVLARHGADVPGGAVAGPSRQRCGVLPGQLRVGDSQSARSQQTKQPRDRLAVGACNRLGGGGAQRDQRDYDPVSAGCGVARGGRSDGQARLPQPVWDILDCGPRNRFVVLGESGPFIVHNCTQAVAADIQFEALARCEARGYPIVMHTHDEGVAEVPVVVGSADEMSAVMAERPAWASWWPIRAAGNECWRYGK